ncbi:MAG: Antilisterial bacteriocin subtilosin biosynthesis protein AlbA [Chloroflexi bacterium ADurb.Bin222]|nr:MAG: Antilisterial bacteriocin subtilosin biosynthesis protein AlbA [Chloroflexi bacterium ADurb.Bin222]
MPFSRQLLWSLAKYTLANKIRGRRRFPFVLMLEPTLRCNLACAGCGRIRELQACSDHSLTLAECLAAVDETGAPIISVTGGEPLLHPDIVPLIQQILARKRGVTLCTNGLLLKGALDNFSPSPYLSFVVHLDGLAQTHDGYAGREGVFATAIEAITAAKRRGFRVMVNTTLYKTTEVAEVVQLLELLAQIPVDGIMIAPAFGFQAVEADLFLTRAEAIARFGPIADLQGRVPFADTPLYLDFLTGERQLACLPWSTPTRNPRGWRQPCYLLADAYLPTFQALMEETDWDAYGTGNDPRCANCMVHSGHDAAAMNAALRSFPDLWRLIKWALS